MEVKLLQIVKSGMTERLNENFVSGGKYGQSKSM